jgi:protein SCO1
VNRNACLAWLCFTLGFAAMTPVLADPARLQQVDHSAGWPLGPFTLVDHRDSDFTQANLQGRWTFLLLGDTRCGEPCVAALSALDGLYRRIGRTQAIKTTQVVFVSWDSDGDTPARLARYLEPYDPRFIGVTGASPTLDKLADDLGVPLSPTESADARGHLGSIWLIGPDGVIRVRFLPPYDVPLLTAEYLKTRLRG